MEKLFHARWWDYSDKKWNINGRICFWISVGWGLLTAVFVFGIQPVFEDLTTGLYRFQPLLPNILAVSLTGLFLIDTVVSVKAALSIGNRLEQLESWALCSRSIWRIWSCRPRISCCGLRVRMIKERRRSAPPKAAARRGWMHGAP